jgi:hypothetical protein
MTRLLLSILCLFLNTASWGEERPLPAEAQVVTSESLATDYSEQLSPADRLAGLSLLWSEARYNFANFDLVPDLDWDAHYHATVFRQAARLYPTDRRTSHDRSGQ